MVFGQLQAWPRLVLFAAYLSRINGPNEDSGGGRRGRESLTHSISHSWYPPTFLISASCIQT